VTDCQHGFVKDRSNVSNVFEYSSFMLNSIESKFRCIQSTRTFLRSLIKYVIVSLWTRSHSILSHLAAADQALIFPVEPST
jgi:hypothetical protein